MNKTDSNDLQDRVERLETQVEFLVGALAELHMTYQIEKGPNNDF